MSLQFRKQLQRHSLEQRQSKYWAKGFRRTMLVKERRYLEARTTRVDYHLILRQLPTTTATTAACNNRLCICALFILYNVNSENGLRN